jgi:hypothetical protein
MLCKSLRVSADERGFNRLTLLHRHIILKRLFYFLNALLAVGEEETLSQLSDAQNIPPAYEDVVKDTELIQETSSEKSPSLNGVCESPSPTPVVIVDEEELSR